MRVLLIFIVVFYCFESQARGDSWDGHGSSVRRIPQKSGAYNVRGLNNQNRGIISTVYARIKQFINTTLSMIGKMKDILGQIGLSTIPKLLDTIIDAFGELIDNVNDSRQAPLPLMKRLSQVRDDDDGDI